MALIKKAERLIQLLDYPLLFNLVPMLPRRPGRPSRSLENGNTTNVVNL
jgi:hypothetical protein